MKNIQESYTGRSMQVLGEEEFKYDIQQESSDKKQDKKKKKEE